MPWDSRAAPVVQETLSNDCRIMLHSARDHLAGQSVLEDSNEVSDVPLDFPISTPATPRWSYTSPDECNGSQDHVIDCAGLFAHYAQETSGESIMDGTADGNPIYSSGHTRGASDEPSTASSSDRTHSDSSIPESSKTSGGSSLSSMARKVARHAGPDMRLIDFDRGEWASRFFDRKYRRWSTGSSNSNQSDKGEVSRSTSATATQSNVGRTTPPSPWPLPDTPSVMRRPSTDALAAQKAGVAPIDSPPTLPPSTDVTTPGSLNTLSNSGPTSEIAQIDETYSPLQASGYSWDSVEKQDTKGLSGKRSRPSFPRWKSHRSQRSKDTARSSGQSDPPLSPSLSPPLSPNKVVEDTATAVQMKKVTATRLYQQKSRRSLKRWLWPGPLSASDAQSIGEVIQPQEMQTVNPAEGFPRGDALPHAKAMAPLPGPESPTRFRRDRLMSPPNSSHPSSSQAQMTGCGHGFVPHTPDLFTPFCRLERRERTSYFRGSDEHVKEEDMEDAEEDGKEDGRRYYNADYIGSALGGLSPPGTPDESPEKPEPEKQPEYFEYTTRRGTARNSTFPAGFSPEDTTPISPRTKRAGFVLDTSPPQQLPTPYPAPQTPALGAHSVRPPRIRRQMATASSGHWDSDAVLMSQPDMTTPDQTPDEPMSYMYPYSPSRSTRASTATTTSLATANTSATSNTATTDATVLSDATIKPRPSTSSIATSSTTTTALPRTSIASFHRPLSSPHRSSTGNSTTANSPSSPSKPTPPVTPGKTTNTALRRVRRESTRSEARSLPESPHTTGSTGSGGTSRSGPPKPRDWFRVRMDQIMADDVGGAAVGGIAHLPPPSPVPPAGGSNTGAPAAGGVAATATGAVGTDHAPPHAPPRSLRSTLSNESTHSHSHNHNHRDSRAPASGASASARPVAHTAASAGDVSSSGGGVGGPEFVWDVPEHLPGSPLCPLSPKHRGGGRGICVYHGRRKTQRTAELML
ncbi:hypothetical protein IWX90DRAFT_309804 [Phyllosticta citrichinensis]|uniref:Uncharacterized protein n=1 Tax=Phyllosticta citrichinensis TaxID=1130410 RepID=A0ABR1XM58_9PEZI